MADEAGQKAMLYFIEVLMNSSMPLSISQLAGRFGSKSFTSEMRIAAGGNEDGLKNFLAKYPSLFHIEGKSLAALHVLNFSPLLITALLLFPECQTST